MTVAENHEAIARLRADTQRAIGELQGRTLDVPKTLESALSYVYRRVGYVQKRTSRGLNYSFAGEAELIRHLRPVMAEAGLVGPIPVGVDHTVEEHSPTRGGARQTRHVVVVRFRLLHAPSGEALDIVAPGFGIDTGDKGTSKAMTAAYKYALRQTFCIETGDDPDETPSATQESAAVTLPDDPDDADHDPKWDADVIGFVGALKTYGLDYRRDVKPWAIRVHKSKPSTWGREGRRSFMRDLQNDEIPELHELSARNLRAKAAKSGGQG